MGKEQAAERVLLAILDCLLKAQGAAGGFSVTGPGSVFLVAPSGCSLESGETTGRLLPSCKC